MCAVRWEFGPSLDEFVERGPTHVTGTVDGGLEGKILVVHDDGYQVVEVAL